MSELNFPSKKTILLSIGGLSAQHLPTYGNNWIETPGINRLANRSEVYEFAFANEIAVGAAVSIPEWEPLPEPSVLLTDCGESISPALQEKFSEVLSLGADEPTGLAAELEQTQLAQIFAQTIDQLHELLQSDVKMIWIELKGMFGAWDAPYSVRESFVEEDDPAPPFFLEPPAFDLRGEGDVDPDTLLGIQQAFAAQMFVLDTCLGVLLDELNLEHNNRLVLGLTSPKGYPLGEHRVIGVDQPILFSESAHVPWIVHNAGFQPTVFRHQDLFDAEVVMRAFLESAIGAPNINADLMGPADSDLIVLRIPGEESPTRLVRTRAWLLVEVGEQAKLFVKPDDRFEFNDVSSRRVDVVEELQQIADAWEQAKDAGREFDVKLEDHLMATWGR